VERDVAGAGRPGAGSEQDVAAFENLRFARAADFDAVRIDERSFAAKYLNAVASGLVLEDLPLGLVDVADHEPQVVHRDVALAAVLLFVDIAMPIAGEMENRFADGLRGDGAGVERDATQEFLLPLNDGDAPVLFGSCNRCFLAGGSATND